MAATSYGEAVEQAIISSNQLHDVINGAGDAEVTVEDGSTIPTVRKALIDNFFFKSPIDWVDGDNETVFNQLRFFENGILSGYYFAPKATVSTPIPMGSTPETDVNWVLYAVQQDQIPSQVYQWIYSEGTGEETVLSPPYVFDTAIVTINGVVQIPSVAYTITNSQIILTEPLGVDPVSGQANILFAYIGKIVDSDSDYIQASYLRTAAGAGAVGVTQGGTVQDQINSINTAIPLKANKTDLSSTSTTSGATQIGISQGGNLQTFVNSVLSAASIPSVAALRNTEPSTLLNTVHVEAYYTGWAATTTGPVGGGSFYYDSADTTTADDGVFTFVTTTGKRWKRKLENKNYNITMGGIRPGDDYTAVLNTLIAKRLASFTSQTTTDYVPINYEMGTIDIPPGNYIQSSTIQVYTVTPLNFLGPVSIDARTVTTGKGVFNLSNDGFPAANQPKYYNGGPLINGASGRINIVGSLSVPAFAVGNTVASCAPCSGYMIDNANLINCTKAIDFVGSIDTYLCHFSKIGGYNFSGNGIDFSSTTSTNSGERMTFDEITISGVTGHAINVSQPGVMIVFDRLSIDFVNGNAINITSTATYASIDVTGGSHIEGVDGYFISNTVSTNKIVWTTGQWLPTSRTNGTRSNFQGRVLVYGALQTVKLRDVMILNTAIADGSSVFIGLPSDTTTRRSFEATGMVDYFGLVPSQFDIANPGNDFSLETVGTVLSTTNTSLTKFQKPADVTFWLNTCTPTVTSLSDGTTALQIVPNATGGTGNYLVLTTVDYMSVVSSKSRVKVWLVGQPLTSSIRYRVQVGVKWYDSNKNLLATTSSSALSDIYSNSQVTTSPSYSTDATTNGNRKLATYVADLIAPAGAVYAKPLWTVSGIDQTININQLNCAVI